MRALLPLAASLLVACTATLPEGQYRCATGAADECPEGWSCVAGRCRSTPTMDGGTHRDATPDDLRDGGDADDAGGDAGLDGGAAPTLAPVAVLLPDDPTSLSSEFGRALDFEGRRIAVGAPAHTANSGAVYLFEASGFEQIERYTVASSGSPELGFDVALSDGSLFAGRPGANEVVRFDLGSDAVRTLAGGDGFFGGSVARLDPGRIAVGAYRRGASGLEDVGAVERRGLDGTPDGEVGRDGLAAMGDVFGSALAVDDDARWLAVGAPSRGSQPGFVVLHDLRSGLSRRITGPRTGDKFGVSVTFWGDLLAVGADENTSGTSADGVGRVYLYEVATGTPMGSIEATESGDRFGAAVCAAGSALIVGAPLARAGRGAVHVYARAGLTHLAELSPAPDEDVGQLGRACAVNAYVVVIGAPASRPTGLETGAVYAFDVSTLAER